MEDRRRSYRFHFSAPERPSVRLERTHPRAVLQAQLVDLGVEGMRMLLPDTTAALHLDERWLSHLELPRLAKPLTVTGSVVYLERVGADLHCGIHFLPLLVPAASDERERTLWKFLMEEQRRRRKQARSSGVRLKLFTGA